jgi:hypothetical protein
MPSGRRPVFGIFHLELRPYNHPFRVTVARSDRRLKVRLRYTRRKGKVSAIARLRELRALMGQHAAGCQREKYKRMSSNFKKSARRYRSGLLVATGPVS